MYAESLNLKNLYILYYIFSLNCSIILVKKEDIENRRQLINSLKNIKININRNIIKI